MIHSIIFDNYFWIIYLAAFCTSIISSVAGFMGGAMLLAVMAQFLKFEALIPLHAIIQLGSNMSRGWFLRKYVNWNIARDSIIGTILGGITGYFYMLRIPEDLANLALGLFILLLTFTPKFKTNFNFPGKWMIIGFAACSIGLLVGAIGAFVGALLLSENLDKRSMVATQSTLQMVVHLAKILVFMSIGVALTPWLFLISGAMLATYLGAYVGTKILDLIPQALFKRLMTFLLTILSLRLVFDGIGAIL